ncbi:expressed unknown protein [Seminavis robusta]|uniref:Uncharacterized protein n=1 Tax=Seminavis robusta TaxID=568900 RepID=A0A9N8EF78_9STRA|nr:expressed unknown protein [Seminavis robusta]|eukprot:Sro912_g219350.1 n/a (320) ;mRNA; r:35005-35964
MSAKRTSNLINADESSAFYANNDAASYNTRYLRSIRNKERFQELHFYRCTVELIDELFPKRAGKGTLDPTETYRASASTIAEWRDLEQEEQMAWIEKERELKAQAGSDSHDSVAALPESAPPESAELKRSMEEQPMVPVPVAKIARQEEPIVVNAVNLEVPYSWDPYAYEVNTEFLLDRTCRGITLDFLKQAFLNEDAKLRGFSIVVGDAMNYKAQTYANNQSWPFASDPRVVGAIVEQMTTDNTKTIIVLKWICVIMAASGVTTNGNKMDSIHFHHPLCDRASTQIICEKCKLHGIHFIHLCSAAVEKQQAAMPGGGI